MHGHCDRRQHRVPPLHVMLITVTLPDTAPTCTAPRALLYQAGRALRWPPLLIAI